MTHCRSANVELRSCWMLGSATFTMVMSSSSMNVPRQTAASVHHFGSVDVRPAVVERVLTPPSSRYVAVRIFAGRVDHLGDEFAGDGASYWRDAQTTRRP